MIKKINGKITVPQKLLKNRNESFKEYAKIDKYGFPYYATIEIISKCPTIVKK